jgi:L-lactate dehydrogenase complex protein LldG
VDAVARSPAAAGSLLPRVVARPATTARDEILPRIADAVADVPVGEQPGDVAVPRRYERGAQGDIVEQFVERVSEYRADGRRVAGAELAATVAEVCRERGIVRLGVPADLPAAWLPGRSRGAGGRTARSASARHARRRPHRLRARDRRDGTIVLDTGPRQGPRTLSLVPDHHLCVVDEADRGRVPEAMSSIARTIVRPVAR